MTPFGNRDFERTPVGEPDSEGSTGDATTWMHDDALSRLLERAAPAEPVAQVTRDTRRVVVRMHGGEDIELARVEGRDAAVEMARDMVRTIDAAETSGEWPLVGDRFLRPGAIVSIDVQRAATA